MNCATITLVPKVPNPSLAKDLRLVALCFTLSKIITARLQTAIADIVDVAQSGFIPGRMISENILMAT